LLLLLVFKHTLNYLIIIIIIFTVVVFLCLYFFIAVVEIFPQIMLITNCTSNICKGATHTLEPRMFLTADKVRCSFKPTTWKPSCRTRRRMVARWRLAQSVDAMSTVIIGRGPLSITSNIDSCAAADDVNSAAELKTFSFRPFPPPLLSTPEQNF